MFNHIMIGSSDIERSKRFYDAVLGVLGAGEPIRNETPAGIVRLFYRHDGNTLAITQPLTAHLCLSPLEITFAYHLADHF